MWPSASRITGRSGVTPSIGFVTMYMCSQAWSGTVTPLMRPSSRAHMPAQLTRISVAMGPWDVSTAAAGQRLGDRCGVGLAVAGDPHGADQVVGAHERVALARPLTADHLGVDSVGARERGVALELDHALGRARHGEAAAALPARRLARLGLQPSVEVGAVPDEPGQVARGAQLAHE